MICHLSFSHFSRSGPYSASGFVHSDSITNCLQSCCVPGVRDPIECPLSFFLKIRFVLKGPKDVDSPLRPQISGGVYFMLKVE